MQAMRLLAGIGVLGLIACGDSAEDQCKETVDALCDKFAECSNAEGDAALDIENKCLKALKPSCAEADEEVPSVDECLEAIDAAKCDDFEAGDDDFLPPELRACEVK